jgi:hypothetical protein
MGAATEMVSEDVRFNVPFSYKNIFVSQALLAQPCNPRYLGGRDQVQGQPRQITHKTPSSKITRAKWTGDVVQVVECFCKCKALSSKTQSHQKQTKNPTFVPTDH